MNSFYFKTGNTLRAGISEPIQNGLLDLRKQRKQDTTDEYPKGRNSCLVLKIFENVCPVSHIVKNLDTEKLQAI